MAILRKENGSLIKKAGKALVDLALNATSHNAIANSAVTSAINGLDSSLTGINVTSQITISPLTASLWNRYSVESVIYYPKLSLAYVNILFQNSTTVLESTKSRIFTISGANMSGTAAGNTSASLVQDVQNQYGLLACFGGSRLIVTPYSMSFGSEYSCIVQGIVRCTMNG